jgi:hypothetical protein
MTYGLKLKILSLIATLKELKGSTARCYCGRVHRLGFDFDFLENVDVIENALKAEPELTRNQLIEVK